MKCMFIILNKVEALDDLLAKLGDNGINGATILSSTGMAHRLLSEHENAAERFLGSMRFLLNPQREENKTVLCVLREDQVLLARAAVHAVLGDLSQPDTGIMFTIPVDFIEGGSFQI